jgi:transposase
MRRGMQGLALQVQEGLRRDPHGGDLYIFRGRRGGGITKTGNTHARRALVEGTWAYRMKARIGRHKVDRIEVLPKAVRDIGWEAQVRLCARYRRLSARGKTANVVNVAIAREMVGFIWSIACTIQSTPKTA